MATSTKVQFNLETLKRKAFESIDFRIAQKELELASYDDDATLQKRVDDWRAQQEERVSDLFSRLGERGIDNHSLSKWKVDPIPETKIYERQAAERELRSLRTTRTKIEAKAESLVPDAEGNISLTKTQLGEFFDL